VGWQISESSKLANASVVLGHCLSTSQQLPRHLPPLPPPLLPLLPLRPLLHRHPPLVGPTFSVVPTRNSEHSMAPTISTKPSLSTSASPTAPTRDSRLEVYRWALNVGAETVCLTAWARRWPIRNAPVLAEETDQRVDVVVIGGYRSFPPLPAQLLLPPLTRLPPRLLLLRQRPLRLLPSLLRVREEGLILRLPRSPAVGPSMSGRTLSSETPTHIHSTTGQATSGSHRLTGLTDSYSTWDPIRGSPPESRTPTMLPQPATPASKYVHLLER
jgi:hypothetical protein